MKGHVYSDRNKMCYVGIRIDNQNYLFDIEYSGTPYLDTIEEINKLLCTCNLLVGFNMKFDLGYFHRYGIDFSHCHIFDLQLCEFLFSNQSMSYPSLDGCLIKYNLGSKSVVVHNDFWAHGIDTDAIPREILEEYLISDLENTDKLFRHLSTIIPESKKPLLKLLNQDLQVLLEMEGNGILFAWNEIEKAKIKTEIELKATEKEIIDKWIC